MKPFPPAKKSNAKPANKSAGKKPAAKKKPVPRYATGGVVGTDPNQLTQPTQTAGLNTANAPLTGGQPAGGQNFTNVLTDPSAVGGSFNTATAPQTAGGQGIDSFSSAVGGVNGGAGMNGEMPLALDPAAGGMLATPDNPNQISSFGGAISNGQSFTLNDVNQSGAKAAAVPDVLYALNDQANYGEDSVTYSSSLRPQEYREGNYWSKADAASGKLMDAAQMQAYLASHPSTLKPFQGSGNARDRQSAMQSWNSNPANYTPVPTFTSAKNPNFLASTKINQGQGGLGDARAGLFGNTFRGGANPFGSSQKVGSNFAGGMAGGPSQMTSSLPGGSGLTGASGRQWNRRMGGANPFGFDQGGGAGLQGGLPAAGEGGEGLMSSSMPAYATGGMIGQEPNGAPGMQMPGQEGGYMDHQTADSEITNLLESNPQVKQQIQQVIQEGIQTGAINPQMAQMAVQLAQACLQNPALYPQLRKFAIQRGIADQEDLPEQYDQGLVMTILMASKAAQGMSDQPPQQSMAQNAQQHFAQGGMIQGPGTGTSDSVQAVNTSNGQPVKVSNGEYIIPQAVVAAKGRDFFDALVRKYAEVPR
jgi:hypothetical protein